MTSQLNVDTIVDKAGSGGTNVKVANTSTYVSDGGAVTQNTVQGLAKNWIKFNQVSGNVVRDSFNLSSLTDIATAQAGINFTNSFANDDYAMTGTGSNTYSNSQSKDIVMLEDQTNSTSLSNVCIKYGGQANGEDRDHISVVHHGDLA